MKFGTRPMSEYSLSHQRRDYQDALPPPYIDGPSPPQPDTCFIQHQSQLLYRLPIEIRLQIWQYAIGNRKLHIINKYRRLGHAVMDDEYWRQHNAARPDLRACSWMYTFGSLPATRQLTDENLCDLLVTCRQVYHEARDVLYKTNTFAFRDLRTIATFKRCISCESWQRLRSVLLYAMFYRKEDDDHAVEACSVLQLEVWPESCAALATVPNLRRLQIYVGNPQYLDKQYLMGQRRDVHRAILEFVKDVRLATKELEVHVAGSY